MRGMTLIQTLITVSMALVVIGLSVPSFQEAVQASRATVAANDLVEALQLARSESIKLRRDVRLCRRAADATGCAADGADWSVGWLACVSPCSAADQVLRVWEAPQGTPVLTSSVDAGVTFEPCGLAKASASFDLAFGGSGGDELRCVAVNKSGQVRTTREACP